MATASRELGHRAVRARRWLVRPARRRHDARSATGSSTGASCPNGIDGLARKVEALGLRFGLWIEPEMVSARSQLFADHPDWAIGVPGRTRTESRQQLRARPVARRRSSTTSSALCPTSSASAPVSYVKWDMNRNITEPYSLGPAGRPAGRVLPPLHPRRLRPLPAPRRPRSRTSCSSRVPAAAAGSTPGCWPSRRRPGRATTRTPSNGCAIQWGTSLVYPLSAMGAHVAAVPNHQVGRITPLATRAAVAFFGVFGYELDPTRFSADERHEVIDQVAFYKAHRELSPARTVRPASRARSTATAIGRPGWWSSSDRRTGHRRGLPGAEPARCRDPTGCRCAGSTPSGSRTGSRCGRSTGDGVERANALVRGGDDLMATGLLLAVGASRSGALGRLLGAVVRARGGLTDPSAPPSSGPRTRR